MHTTNETNVTLGPLTVRLSTNTIEYQQTAIKVAPKVAELLRLLLQNPNEVLSRDYLVNELWPGRFGADESLSKTVSELRKHLKECDGSLSTLIKTVPKRGYQLLANEPFLAEQENEDCRLATDATNNELRTENDAGVGKKITHAEADKVSTSNAQGTSSSKKWLALALIILSALSLLAINFSNSPQTIEAKQRVLVMPFDNLTPDTDLKRISDGFVNTIIDELANHAQLEVASATSSFYLKQYPQQLDKFTSEKEIDYILEGALADGDGPAVLNYRLIDRESGFAVWSKKVPYQEQHLTQTKKQLIDDVLLTFDIERVHTEPHQLLSDEALRLYLLAIQKMSDSYSRENFEQAEDYLMRAEKLHPSNIDILIALAINTLDLKYFASPEEMSALTKQAEHYIDKAQLYQAPEKKIAYLRGNLYTSTNDLLTSSERALAKAYLDKAYQLGESSFDFYFTYTYFQTVIGNLDKALEVAEEGIRVHPLAYRLHAAKAAVQILSAQPKALADTLVVMREVGQNEWSTDWMASFQALLSQDYQRSFEFAKQVRDKGELERSIRTDASFMMAMSRSDLLTVMLDYCVKQNVDKRLCDHIRWTLALAKSDYSAISMFLENIDAVNDVSFYTANLYWQSLMMLKEKGKAVPIDDINFDVIKEHVVAGTFYVMKPSVALDLHYLGLQDHIVLPEEIGRLLKEQEVESRYMDDYLKAEYYAYLGNLEKTKLLLNKIANETPMRNSGRLYKFFDSPYFSALKKDEEFQQLKELFLTNMKSKSGQVVWVP